MTATHMGTAPFKPSPDGPACGQFAAAVLQESCAALAGCAADAARPWASALLAALVTIAVLAALAATLLAANTVLLLRLVPAPPVTHAS